MTAGASAADALETADRALRRGLRAFRWRVRLLLGVGLAAFAVAVTAGAAAATVLALRLMGLWYPAVLPEVMVGAVVAAAAAAAAVWPLPDASVAISVDRRLRLRDRLGSALELVRRGSTSGMSQAAVADALGHLRLAQPRAAYPLHVHRGAKAAGICLAALVLVQTLPIPALLLSPREREERAQLRQEAAKIEPLAKRLEQVARETGDEEAERAARSMKKLAQQLRRGQLTKKQALLKLGELEQDFEQLDKRLAAAQRKTAQTAAEQLQKAARDQIASKAMDLAGRAAKAGRREAAERLRGLAQQAQDAQSMPELMSLAQQVGRDASELGLPFAAPPELLASLAQLFSEMDIELSEEMLRELAEASGLEATELTRRDLEALAEELEALAKTLEGTELAELAELLEQAAACLRAGDCEKAAELLGSCQSALCLAGMCSASKGELAGILGRLRGYQLAAPRRATGVSGGLGRGGIAEQPSIPPSAPGATLYSPRATETSGTPEHVRAQVRPRGRMLATSERGAPSQIDAARVPYYEVLSEYSATAEEALSREQVPPAYRATVREYFDALQSGTKP